VLKLFVLSDDVVKTDVSHGDVLLCATLVFQLNEHNTVTVHWLYNTAALCAVVVLVYIDTSVLTTRQQLLHIYNKSPLSRLMDFLVVRGYQFFLIKIKF